MQPEMETTTIKTANGWADKDGYVGPFQPGKGPRSDPRGEFPTGPAVGETMPNIVCNNIDGTPFNLHEQRNGQPAVFIFYRSAVW